MENTNNRIVIILPCNTKVTRVSSIKLVGSNNNSDSASEVKTEFSLLNPDGEKVHVSPNMKFEVSGKTLWLCGQPIKYDENHYKISLNSGVKYFNQAVQSGTLAYNTQVVLSPESEVIIPAGTTVWIDFGEVVDIVLKKNVKAKIV